MTPINETDLIGIVPSVMEIKLRDVDEPWDRIVESMSHPDARSFHLGHNGTLADLEVDIEEDKIVLRMGILKNLNKFRK